MDEMHRKEPIVERKRLVVVADDNADIRTLVTRRLARRGYDVETARDGQEALALILSRRPDAAVLDWLMPNMQGHELARALKDNPETSSIPLLMLTARAAEGDIERGFENGVDEYLTKPFEIEELDQTLRRLIRAG